MPASMVSQLRLQAAFRWVALLSEHRPVQVGTVVAGEAMEMAMEMAMAAATAQAAGTVTALETAMVMAAETVMAMAMAEETATVQENEAIEVVALSADRSSPGRLSNHQEPVPQRALLSRGDPLCRSRLAKSNCVGML
jgi:hypothetical protein